jgi:hypothetical protein
MRTEVLTTNLLYCGFDRQKTRLELAIACQLVAKHQGKIEVNC